LELAIICVAAFGASILTFFSGFGLGTILTPIFMIFFPVEVAIALTGVVHFFNNIFKLLLVGRNADKFVLICFGIPAVVAAFFGSQILLNLTHIEPLFNYSAFGRNFEVYPIEFTISILLIVFATIDLLPVFNRLQFEKNMLPIGGALSGFFGGLSGNQGALRSAFLIKAGLSKEAFIGSAVVVSTFVDFTRLSVYASGLSTSGLKDNITLISAATLSAILGAFIGNKLLKKVTLKALQTMVAIMLIILSIALGSGLL